MLKLFFKKIKNNWPLLLIILISALIRLYKLPEMVSYDYDQEYVSRFVLDVVKDYPIRFVGQGLSVMGLFLGPFYFYLLVPFYLLTNLNPIGGYIGSIFLGLINIFLYYFVAKKIFKSKSAGLLAAMIRGFGSYAVINDWLMAPAYSSDILVLLVIYLLFQIWNMRTGHIPKFRQESFYILPLLFFTFGLFTSIHPIQFPLIIVSLLLIFIWKKRFSISNWLVSILAMLSSASPIIYFDKLRNWSMIRQILGMFLGSQNIAKSENFSWDRYVSTLKSINALFRSLVTVNRFKIFLSIYILVIGWLVVFYLIKRYQKKQAKFHIGLVVMIYLCFYLIIRLLFCYLPDFQHPRNLLFFYRLRHLLLPSFLRADPFQSEVN